MDVSPSGTRSIYGGLAGVGDLNDSGFMDGEILGDVIAEGNQVLSNGTVVITQVDDATGFPLGTVIAPDGTVYFPDGSFTYDYTATDAPTPIVLSDDDVRDFLKGGNTDWSGYALTSEQRSIIASAAAAQAWLDWADQQDGNTKTTVSAGDGTAATVTLKDVKDVLLTGVDLFSAVRQAANAGSNQVRINRPTTTPVILPFPARVQLPDGRIVTLSKGTTLPVGSKVLQQTAPGTSGGLGASALLFGVLGIAALAIWQKKRG